LFSIHVFCEHPSPVDKSACNLKPKSLRRAERNPFHGGHNELGNYSAHRRLLENRETINAKIRGGIEQLDRGDGIPEDQLDAQLANLKSRT
jgi:hypothetical protein